MESPRCTAHELNPVVARARSEHSNEGVLHATEQDGKDSNADKASSISERDPEKGTLGEEGAVQDHRAAENPKKCTCGFHPGSDLVDFDGPNDLGNPKNWSKGRKWAITTSMGFMTFAVTFSSSIFSVAIEPVAAEFGVSTVVSTLGVALFLFVCHPAVAWVRIILTLVFKGFVFGPVFFGAFVFVHLLSLSTSTVS
jgi:hypothetical protein